MSVMVWKLTPTYSVQPKVKPDNYSSKNTFATENKKAAKFADSGVCVATLKDVRFHSLKQ